MNEPSTLLGHETAWQQVMESLASGRMHHAWLITGIEGIGKATMAAHIARHVVTGGAGKHADINAAHPDMLTIRRALDEKTGELRSSIVADDARKIAPFLHRTAAHSGWRVVVVDEVHAMNRTSLNAILKILEEPPPQALILLTATTPGALLPTIRSRCCLLPLTPLSDNHMRVVLMRAAPHLSAEDASRLIGLAGGSAGFALRILHSEVLPLYEELRELLAAAPLDVARLHKLADQIGRKADAESYAVVTTLLIDLLRRAARTVATGQSGEGDAWPGAPLPLDRALQLWEKTEAAFAVADGANLDRKLAFINAVTEIKRAA